MMDDRIQEGPDYTPASRRWLRRQLKKVRIENRNYAALLLFIAVALILLLTAIAAGVWTLVDWTKLIANKK